MSTQAEGVALEERHSRIPRLRRDLRLLPQAGDVLASARTARADFYTISIIPADAHLRAHRHAEALEKVSELARGLEVDAWFTCNHTHYARVARFRKTSGDRTAP